ncbi:hypothetical protein [Leptolyngbya sp. CCY15150]|uniref:hypothetical protein n=1 Tax=Leptolyngbya sp. CCY15150 TaxID=2767772 RepID=UPI00194E5C03|nr:hypothetical protein [Leptolyngbya sp. CCY15150]
MANSQFSHLSPEPLHRLSVYDGLMLNAERWLIAHDYHRRRQNLHYQALHLPGIVYGLGVRVIEPPEDSSGSYRNQDRNRQEQRWIEVQPGMAIDTEGNPIIVDADTDRTYRIAAKAPERGTRTVYIVVSYVEPDSLERKSQEMAIAERFRLDQKTTPPTQREVELCRVVLTPGKVSLSRPQDVFAPASNQLDFRYRCLAQVRAQGTVNVASLSSWSNQTAENFEYLVRSLPALYPQLQGQVRAEPLANEVERLPKVPSIAHLMAYELLYLKAKDFISFEPEGLKCIQVFLSQGGVILVGLPDDDSDVEQYVQQRWQNSLKSWTDLPINHRLRTQPFVFTQPPTLGQTVLKLLMVGGFICIKERFLDAWGIRGSYSREDTRTAHEFGINLLHFAWQRRHLNELVQWSNSGQ